MKLLTTVAISVLMLAPLSAQAQTPAKAPAPTPAPAAAPVPGPEHQKLSALVGDWFSEGEAKATPLWPAGKFTTKMNVRSILGGFFLQFQGEQTDAAGNASKWIEIDGYDPVKKRFTSILYGDDGGTTALTYTFEGTTTKYEGTIQKNDKQHKMRGTIEYAKDFMTSVEKCEVSVDGKKWMPGYEIKGTRVKTP